MMVWIGLLLFVAAWMFVLGILVGRGMAPVNLDAGKLEQELAALKAKMLRQEQSRGQARASGQEGAKSELGFYEALKDPKGQKRYKTMPVPKPPDKPRTMEHAPARPSTPVAQPSELKPKPVVRPAPEPQPAPKTSKPSGKYTVQVSAVKDAQRAARLVAELRKKGFRAYQIRTEVPGNGVWYRVRVGAFSDRASADKMAGKLKVAKYGAMVVTAR
jgi:cell division septation protein DedD